MTDHSKLDLAILAIVAECSDRIQKRVTDAANEEVDALIGEGHAPLLVVAGCVSGITATLFAAIIAKIEPQHQLVTVLDCSKQLVATATKYHAATVAGAPDGVTVQ